MTTDPGQVSRFNLKNMKTSKLIDIIRVCTLPCHPGGHAFADCDHTAGHEMYTIHAMFTCGNLHHAPYLSALWSQQQLHFLAENVQACRHQSQWSAGNRGVQTGEWVCREDAPGQRGGVDSALRCHGIPMGYAIASTLTPLHAVP